MRRFLLDTNIVSETRRPRPHGAVLAWLSSLPSERLLLSAVTIGEIQAGIERARPQHPEKAAEIERWLDELPDAFATLPMDAKCFREFARIMHGKPSQILEDAMIAATARVHDLVVATRNERDFARLGVEVFNPFKS